MSTDNTQKFSGRADDYAIGRPSYADGLIQSLFSEYGFSSHSIVADIGAGTGKFARQLLDKGCFVYGVEPNDDMRSSAAKALENYKNFQAVNGSASDTTLNAHSIDFVTAAQAFHWFDAALFAKECRRILKPDSKVFLIWNHRDMSCAVNRQNYEICSLFCPDFKGFSGGINYEENKIKEFFSGNYRYAEFDNPLCYDRERFIHRCLSSSYSINKGDNRYHEYVSSLEKLFEQYSENNILTVNNKTVVYFGKID